MNREERRKFARDNAIELKGLKKVGQRLPGVNIGTPESRFAGGVPLHEQVDEVVRQVQQQPVMSQVHLPIIAPLTEPEGAWGVSCLACSYVAGEFIYPCDKWPAQAPQVLTEYVPSPSEV